MLPQPIKPIFFSIMPLRSYALLFMIDSVAL
jgi:hypothetical protein